MANADAAFGFKPVNMDGSPYSGGTVRCVLLTGNGTATFIGDPVQFTAGTSLDGAPEVIQGVAAAAIMGVVTSFEVNPSDLDAQYRKASTQRFCQVALAGEGNYFMVQDDSEGGALGLSAAFLNANFSNVNAGSTVTGLSGAEIDASDATADSSGDLQLWAPVNRADNDGTAVNADWIVKFNTVQTDGSRTGS